MGRKFKKILVIESSKKTKNHKKSAKNIKKILKDLNINHSWIKYQSLKKENLKHKDLIITLGGDGIFIGVSHFLRNTPILGLNSDPLTSEGALKEISALDNKNIIKILNGNYKIKQKTRARIILNNKFLKELAINEVYVGTKTQAHASRYVLKFNKKEEEQRSSGIIISTGTGSTAWFKSTGGKKFKQSKKELRFIVREQFKGKLFKGKITSGKITKTKTIEIYSKQNTDGIIIIDSNIFYDFNKKDRVKIQISKQNLIVITK